MYIQPFKHSLPNPKFQLYWSIGQRRSMSTRPRYHDLGARDQARGKEIRQAVRAIARILGAQNRRNKWQDRRYWRPPRRREPRRNGPRWFDAQDPRVAPPRARGPRHRRPFYDEGERSRMVFQQAPRPGHPNDRRFQAFPRRGPPVAAIKVPRGCRPEDPRKRQPRGINPRGPLRRGPKGQPVIRGENLEVVSWRPRKVSQGNTDTTQDQRTAQHQRRQNGKR